MTIAEAKQLKRDVDEEVRAALQKLADAGLTPLSVYVATAQEFSAKPPRVIVSVDVRL